jgi:hypothetical protein
MCRIFQSADMSKREGLSCQETRNGEAHGLIAYWERGRDKRREAPDLAEWATDGELPILARKGGIEKAVQNKRSLARSTTSPRGSVYGVRTWTSTWIANRRRCAPVPA